MSLNSINSANNNFEKVLDRLGYVPAIGTMSGIVRITYGIAKNAFAHFSNWRSPNEESLKGRAKEGYEQIKKGLCELPPFLSIYLLESREITKNVKGDEVTFKGRYATKIHSKSYGDGSYTGNFNGATPNGKGKITYKDKVLEANFDNGVANTGKITYRNGDVYEGPLQDTNPSGEGKLTANSGVYEGFFNSEKYPAEGKFTHTSNGIIYTGPFSNGKENGKGEAYYPIDKSTIEGTWNEGELVNISKKTYRDGSVYEGEFSKESQFEPEGEGKITLGNGIVIEGTFRIGSNCPERGKLTFVNDEVYKGPIKDFKPFGEGIITKKRSFVHHVKVNRDDTITTTKVSFPDGDEYKGGLDKYGLPQGFGDKISADGTVVKGRYKNGILKQVIKPLKENIEHQRQISVDRKSNDGIISTVTLALDWLLG